jgi:hypothetical protein
MPVSFTIDADRQLVTCLGRGVLTREEMADHIRVLQATPAFNKEYRQLWDLSDVSEIAITFPDMMWLAEVNVFSLTTPRAFLAPADAIFGLARMFAMLRQAKGESGIRVFRERTEAVQWLERTSAPVPVTEK